MNIDTYMDKYMNKEEHGEEYKEMYKFKEGSSQPRKELIPIAKSLGIKYLSWMNKDEVQKEINRVKNGDEPILSKKYMCEHNKQKYKCVLCDGIHVCKHKKQKQSCKKCRLEKEGVFDIQ